mgnify:CR=1 FL=1
MRGKLIVLEGIHGSGKTAVAKEIQSWLQDKIGVSCSILSEMTDFLDNELVAKVFLSKKKPSNKAITDLAKHYKKSIYKAIRDDRSNEQWIIADRYDLSLLVYLNNGVGLDSPLMRLNEEFKWPLADYSYILDCPVQTAMARCTTKFVTEHPETYWNGILNRYRLVTEGFTEYELIDNSGELSDIVTIITSQIGMGIDEEIERDY